MTPTHLGLLTGIALGLATAFGGFLAVLRFGALGLVAGRVTLPRSSASAYWPRSAVARLCNCPWPAQRRPRETPVHT